MASLRRNRAICSDGASPKFLYAILKQLDLKSVDWNEVARQLGITNGHAARMRYSRFKQQMEGIPPPPRKPRSAAVQKEKPKPKSRSKIKLEERLKRENSEETKEESRQPFLNLHEQAPAEQFKRIKDEPFENIDPRNVDDKEWMSLNPHNYSGNDFIDPSLENVDFNSTDTFRAGELEPRVKSEPMWD